MLCTIDAMLVAAFLHPNEMEDEVYNIYNIFFQKNSVHGEKL